MNNGNVSRHLFTCLSKCFASFKHENINSCEMAVNFLNMKQDKKFYIKLGAKGHTYIRTHAKSTLKDNEIYHPLASHIKDCNKRRLTFYGPASFVF